MKNRILFAAVAAFAAKANALLAAHDQPFTLTDASLSNEGSVVACMTLDSTRPLNASGTLIEVIVLHGAVNSVEEQLAAVIAESPYVRPLKVLGFKPQPPAPAAAPAKAGKEAAAAAAKDDKQDAPPPEPEKKPKPVVVVIAGRFQA